MRRRNRPELVTDAAPGLAERQRHRLHVYLWMMGVCLVLIVLAWNVVRLWSVPAAVAMSAVAAIIPPVAAFVANRGSGG